MYMSLAIDGTLYLPNSYCNHVHEMYLLRVQMFYDSENLEQKLRNYISEGAR